MTERKKAFKKAKKIYEFFKHGVEGDNFHGNYQDGNAGQSHEWRITGMNTEYMIQQLEQYKKEQGKETHQRMYDPCRRYRKGDIVRARLYGRGFLWAKDGQIFRVAEDEKDGNPAIIMEASSIHTGQPVHLSYAEIELVKPIEENKAFELYVWDAVRMMREEQKIMERPFIGTNGKPDFCQPSILIRYVPESGFLRRMKNPRDYRWGSYSLNRNDMEVMWREANIKEIRQHENLR